MRFNVWFFLLPYALFALPGYNEPWGKNSDLKYVSPSEQEEGPKLSPLARAMEGVIAFHQNVISPIDGPRSHFKPSSSAYMLQAIRKHGFFKGYVMGCDRLQRENGDPWVYRTTLIYENPWTDPKIWKVDAPN